MFKFKISNDTLAWIVISMIMLGVLCISIDTLGSIIYCIYLWGGKGYEFAAALWEATKTWMQILGVGISFIVLGYISLYFIDRK